MNLQSLLGTKIAQTQGFLEDGTRVPLSVINVGGNVVSQIKTADHEGYNALQLGFGNKRPNKANLGHIKKAGLEEKSPRFFREVRADELPENALGSEIAPQEVFEPGDIIDVIGTSKGKGYAGVVKRHGFHGGPKTHGQSDRHRAPGSSGQGTTPGRVYKGKRMSGRMGNAHVTVKNLEVLDIQGDTIFVRGLVPGIRGGLVVLRKVGKNKKFMPLYSDKKEELEAKVEPVAEIATAQENVMEAIEKVETSEEKVETAQEAVTTPEENVVVEGSESSEKQEAENVENEEMKGEENASK